MAHLPWTPSNPEPINETGPPAVVTVGPVIFEDNNALFKEEEQNGVVWDDCVMINRYENDGKRYMMGVTSPNGFLGTKAAFVQLGLPTLVWICDWTVKREGDVPNVPNPDVAGWVLLDVQLELNEVQVAADGFTPIYRVSGTYFYGAIAQNENIFTNVTFPKPPYIEDPPFPRFISLSKVIQGMSNSESTMVQGPGFGPVRTSSNSTFG